MAGWLTKAAGALRGDQPEEPVPFESICECGVRHSGLRRRKPQRIICRSCGAALFVLPRDSYPSPQAPPPRVKKRKRKGHKEVASVPPTAPPRFQDVATNVFKASEKVGRSAATAGLGFGARLGVWFMAFLALWTPLRLILLACVGICAATIAFVVFSDRSEQAVADLKAANEAARTALAERRIDEAHLQLAAAVKALDTLDRHDDPLAQELRQLLRETNAIRDVLPISPLQVVAEADEAQQNGRGEQWQSRFQTQYRNRWLIIDGPVQVELNGSQRGQYAVQLPLRIGPSRRGVSMHVALPALDLLVKGGKQRPVVMAVQLVGCDLSPDKQTWQLRINSQTAFLWGTLENYEVAGFTLESDEDRQRVLTMLAAQQRVLGLSAPAAADDAKGASASGTVEEGKTP